MHKLIVVCVFASAGFGQKASLGLFTESTDVGASPIPGSASFDAATGQYRVTGSGTDIWGKADQFHFLWRETPGNFSATATVKFLTPGIGHRKAVIMLRKSLDPDSPYVDLVIHGDGTPAVQFRSTKGDTCNSVDFVVQGPGTWKLKLVKQNGTVTVWIGKDGAPLRELGHTMTQLAGQLFLGLGVSSHSQTAVNTVLFSDVSIEEIAAASK